MTAMTGSRVEHNATEMAHHTTGLTRGITPYLQLAPLVILMLVFAVVPLVGMLAITFFKSGIFGLEPQLTLANYVKFTGEGTYVRVLIKSMRIAFIVTATTIVISYPVAFWLAKGRYPPQAPFPHYPVRAILGQLCHPQLCLAAASRQFRDHQQLFSRSGIIDQPLHGCCTTSFPSFLYWYTFPAFESCRSISRLTASAMTCSRPRLTLMPHR